MEWKVSPSSRGAAILMPGLNLAPQRMEPLAEFLREVGFDTRTLSLHPSSATSSKKLLEQWRSTVQAALREAHQRSENVLILGYSLGGLLGLDALQRGESFRQCILIAPPLVLTNLAKPMSWLCRVLPDSWSFSSWNHPDYRESARTSVAAYRALFELIRSVDASKVQMPMGVILSERDELVYSKKLYARYSKAQWKWHWIDESSRTPANRIMRHLMVDGFSLGETEWSRLKKEFITWVRELDSL